jgi:hypothetical protein
MDPEKKILRVKLHLGDLIGRVYCGRFVGGLVGIGPTEGELVSEESRATFGALLESLLKRLMIGREDRAGVKEESGNVSVSESNSNTFVALKIDELGQLKGIRVRLVVGVLVGGKGEIDDTGCKEVVGDEDLMMKELLKVPFKGRLM